MDLTHRAAASWDGRLALAAAVGISTTSGGAMGYRLRADVISKSNTAAEAREIAAAATSGKGARSSRTVPPDEAIDVRRPRDRRSSQPATARRLASGSLVKGADDRQLQSHLRPES